jgi:excisionase family DNA binding protein
MTDALLTAAEVAAALRISLHSFELLIQSGDAPAFFRIGRGRRWREADVRAWVAERITSVSKSDNDSGKEAGAGQRRG